MIELTGDALTIEKLALVAREGIAVAPFSKEVQARMQRSHEWVDRAIHDSGRLIYGVNTGFGSLATKKIQPHQARKLSRNLILTCACGVGPPLKKDLVRAMMVIRANMLANGLSGVRPVVPETLVKMLNADLTPVVPSKGSVGASGDLAPLAHIAVVMTRDAEEGDGGYSGQAWLGDKLLSGAEAMARAGIARLILEAKEGLALSNGIDMMAAAGALSLADAHNLLRHAEIAGALSLEALLGVSAAFHPSLHAVGGQPGHARTAARLLSLTKGSKLLDSQLDRIQDAYSLRCMPQVMGPVHDVLKFLSERLSSALNAVTDNPIIIPLNGGEETHRAISGGNFHGQGPAMWLDFLGIALSEVGSLSERRIFRMLTPELSQGLPSMLVRSNGLDSGLMMVQYTAAALVSDNKTLAHPDSVDSIPTCANQEDHVSMGANAARHTMEILDNVRTILAIELITAAQAVDLRLDGPASLGRGTKAAYRAIREKVAFLESDRETLHDIQDVVTLIQHGDLLVLVEDSLA